MLPPPLLTHLRPPAHSIAQETLLSMEAGQPQHSLTCRLLTHSLQSLTWVLFFFSCLTSTNKLIKHLDPDHRNETVQ